MTHKSPRHGYRMMVAGTCLMLGAFLLIISNMAESHQAEQASQAILSSMNILLPHETPSAVSAEKTPEPAYRLNPGMEMPTEIIDGHAYVGVLEIPNLALSLPVMSEWSYPSLKVSPCRYHGSAYSGDLIICAHNYDRHFGRLNQLSAGDAVYFTDMDGNRFIYEVQSTEHLTKRQTEEMLSGEWDLTLFTCVTGGQKRVTVRCTLADEQPA